MDCVVEAGPFLDLSRDDMKENKSFGFGYMLEGRDYVTVRLSSIYTEEIKKNKKVGDKNCSIIFTKFY